MSVVLKFPLERVSRTSSLRFEERHLTKILVFEGVRYCRTPSDPKALQSSDESAEIAETHKR